MPASRQASPAWVITAYTHAARTPRPGPPRARGSATLEDEERRAPSAPTRGETSSRWRRAGPPHRDARRRGRRHARDRSRRARAHGVDRRGNGGAADEERKKPARGSMRSSRPPSGTSAGSANVQGHPGARRHLRRGHRNRRGRRGGRREQLSPAAADGVEETGQERGGRRPGVDLPDVQRSRKATADLLAQAHTDPLEGYLFRGRLGDDARAMRHAELAKHVLRL